MNDLLNHAQKLANMEMTPIPHSVDRRVAFLVNQGHSEVPEDKPASQLLAEALAQQGGELLCMVWPVGERSRSTMPEVSINGVRYLYSCFSVGIPDDKQNALETSVQQLIKLLRIYRPAVVLAETAGVGLVGWIAARRLNLPFYGVTEECLFLQGSERQAFIESKAHKLFSYSQLLPGRRLDMVQIESLSFSLARAPYLDTFVPTVAFKPESTQYRVMTLLNEYGHACFKDVFDQLPATPEAWLNRLDDDVDMLLVTSRWVASTAGLKAGHQEKVGEGADNGLLTLLFECRKRHIPTVFWFQEDARSYDTFIETARRFDYVFSVDPSTLVPFRNDLNHGRVHLLDFAAQQKVHFPEIADAKNARVALFGSDKTKEYGQWPDSIKASLDGLLEKEMLDIYHDAPSGSEIAYSKYPEKFGGCIQPSILGDDLSEKVFKKYSLIIEAPVQEACIEKSSIRRYEMAGCGAPVIFSSSDALSEKVDTYSYQGKEDCAEIDQQIDSVLSGSLDSLKTVAQGVRLVHSEHTYQHRFAQLVEKISEKVDITSQGLFDVTAICVSRRPWLLHDVAEKIKSQNDVNIHVIYVAHNSDIEKDAVLSAFEGVKSCQFLRLSGEDTVLADGLNLALVNCQTDIVAKIDDDDYYGPNYLLDACLALKYSQAALVGKTSFFCYVESTDDFALRFPDKHYRYFKHVQGGTLMWSREKTDYLTFEKVRQGTDSRFLKSLQASGHKIYSSDPFNFVHVRYRGGHNHTWAIEDEKFMEAAKKLHKGLQFKTAFN